MSCRRTHTTVLENDLVYFIPFGEYLSSCKYLKKQWEKCQKYREEELAKDMSEIFQNQKKGWWYIASFNYYRQSIQEKYMQWRRSSVCFCLRLCHINRADWSQKLQKVVFLDKKIKVQRLKNFYFQFKELQVVDSSSILESFVIVVYFVVVLSGQKETSQQQFMGVAPCESEPFIVQIESVDVDQRNYKTFRLEFSFAVNAFDICFNVDVLQKSWIEIGLDIWLLLFFLNKICEQSSSQKGVLG